MQLCHSGGFAGHFSAKVKTLSKQYWWKGMYRDIYRSCLTCPTYNGSSRRMKSPLMPCVELQLTESGSRYVIVFIDYLTKWVEAFATPDQTSETIVQSLLHEVICRHETLIGELSLLKQETCTLAGIKKINTTAYHPQTDGLLEKRGFVP